MRHCVRWMAAMLRTHVSAHLDPTSLRVLHLGGGACSMARWVHWQWPQARQVVVELDARPVAEAAEWLTQRREQQQAEREALQARQEALARRYAGPTRTGPDHQQGRPGLGL